MLVFIFIVYVRKLTPDEQVGGVPDLPSDPVVCHADKLPRISLGGILDHQIEGPRHLRVGGLRPGLHVEAVRPLPLHPIRAHRVGVDGAVELGVLPGANHHVVGLVSYAVELNNNFFLTWLVFAKLNLEKSVDLSV